MRFLLFLLGVVTFVRAHRFHNEKLKLRAKDDIISIKNGDIIGKTVDLGDFTYNAYLGIPYAKPPVGNLRFKAPEPADKWEGVLNATEDKSMCIQNDGINVIGSEDCLYINVYVPSSKSNNPNFPVMVWVYGGSYFSGDSTNKTYNPEYLIRDDVIFVSFNYRVGILGFATTGDEIAPGNFGIKDQVLALKWVNENINHFKGDKNKVTIFGESAGSGSVSYLTQIEETKNLYRAAIMQSGVSICPWAIAREAKESLIDVARTLGKDATNSSTIINGLREVKATDLQQIATVIWLTKVASNPMKALTYAPVIEPDIKGAVLTKRSYENLKNGNFHKVPQMIGFNSEEGLLIKPIFELIRPYIITFDLDKSKFIPLDLNQNTSDNQEITNFISDFYFGAKPVFLADNEFIRYTSDKMFVHPIHEAVLQISKHVPVYYYYFSYEGQLGDPNRKENSTGVAHAEDNSYIFKREGNDFVVSEKDKLTRKRMITLWTNFAKFDFPTPKPGPGNELLGDTSWFMANTNPDGLTYLDIGEELTMKVNPLRKRIAFWDFIYKAYGNPPFSTY